jgi:hypothetical protein
MTDHDCSRGTSGRNQRNDSRRPDVRDSRRNARDDSRPRQQHRNSGSGHDRENRRSATHYDSRTRSPPRRPRVDHAATPPSKARGAPHLPFTHSESSPIGAPAPGRIESWFPPPPDPKADLRKLLEGLPESEFASIFFGGDALALKLQKIAHSCPPGFQPDLPNSHDDFIRARQQCNGEMMRRVLSLCSSTVRQEQSQNEGLFTPYIVRSQTKRDMQKLFPHIPLNADRFNFNVLFAWMAKNSPYFYEGPDNMAVMIRKVAASLADPGQTELDTDAAAAEAALIDVSRLALMTETPGPRAAAVTFTMQELRDFHPDKLHDGSKIRTLDWALDDKGPDDNDGANTKARFSQYLVALEKLLLLDSGGKASSKGGKSGSGKGRGKGGKNPPAAVINVFKSKCDSMGFHFDQSRNGDVAKLLAVVRARMDQLDA